MGDIELEKAILFYIIYEKEQFELTEKDFIDYKNKKIINAINEFKAKKEDISMLLLNTKLKELNILEYLTNLGEHIRTENPENLYLKLKEYTKKRETLDLLKESQLKLQNSDNMDIYIEKIINKLHKIEFQTEKDESFLNQVVKTANDIEKNINKSEDFSLYTGYLDLDSLTDGLHNGELTVIGARPRCWQNNICITVIRVYCKKRKKCSVYKS